LKQLGIVVVFVILFSQNIFAGGGRAPDASEEYASLSENSPANILFAGRWKESTKGAFNVFEFMEDGSGTFIQYDAGGFETVAPDSIHYRSSSDKIIVRFSENSFYREFTYSFSTDFKTLTLEWYGNGYYHNDTFNKVENQPQTSVGNTAKSVPPPLSLSSQYNVVINGQNYGPYEMDQLKQMVQQGSLTRETLVWKEGMAQWAAAGTVQELLTLFGTNNPPPLPPPPPR
jgi:hypothetical protein